MVKLSVTQLYSMALAPGRKRFGSRPVDVFYAVIIERVASDENMVRTLADRREVPSGKLTIYYNYGKSPFLMGKHTINGHFNSYQCVKLPEGNIG